MNNASAGDNVLGMCTLSNHSHKVSSNWNKKQAPPPPITKFNIPGTRTVWIKVFQTWDIKIVLNISHKWEVNTRWQRLTVYLAHDHFNELQDNCLPPRHGGGAGIKR